jgi:hypothetical protein
MKPRTLLAWLGAACLPLLGLGCGQTQARSVRFDPQSPADGGVTVFGPQAPVGGQDLGTVSVRGGEGVKGNDVRTLYSELVRQARDRGGNAVVIESIDAGPKRDEAARPGDTLVLPCDPTCPDGAPTQVELRGKVLRLLPEDLNSSLRRVP